MRDGRRRFRRRRGFALLVDLAVQQLEAIEDDPGNKLGVVLRERHWAMIPWGRPATGVKVELEGLTAKALRPDRQQRGTPRGAILAVAGNFDWPAVKDAVEEAFGGWSPPGSDSGSGASPADAAADTER